MNKNIIMNNRVKRLIWVLLLGVPSLTFAQNVGINLAGAMPSSNAILDLNTGNKKNLGVLFPRVVLGASLSTFSPPMANASSGKDTGMVVYNWLSTNQPVGYYYWTGAAWASISTSWLSTGNYATTASTAIIGNTVNNNFIGTTNAIDFVIATNNLERIRIASGGNIAIGTKSPQSTLDDSGSMGTGIIKLAPAASSSTALGSGYSTIVATPPATSLTYTLTLPSATANPRRIYTVVYYGSGKGAINITSPVAGNILQNGISVTPLAISQGTVTLQSDGTNWDILNITTGNTFGSFVGIKYITSTTAGNLSFDAGTDAIQIKLIGGGGAGGGGSSNGTNSCGTVHGVSGSGGGAGGYVEGFLNDLTGNSTYSVTIGQGGTGTATCSGGTNDSGTGTILTVTTNTLTTYYRGYGGAGGINNTTNNTDTYAAGGTGGSASSTAAAGTYITVPGASGFASIISVSGSYYVISTGAGASTTYGIGGSALTGRANIQAGVSAVSYGAGGGGAMIAEESSSVKGGNGYQGVVIIYEYQ